jgi:hypothetical protein
MREMYDMLGVNIDDVVILAEINEQSRIELDRLWAEDRLNRTLEQLQQGWLDCFCCCCCCCCC